MNWIWNLQKCYYHNNFNGHYIGAWNAPSPSPLSGSPSAPPTSAEGFLIWTLVWKFQLALYFPLESFGITVPLPLRISNNSPWDGKDIIFVESANLKD